MFVVAWDGCYDLGLAYGPGLDSLCSGIPQAPDECAAGTKSDETKHCRSDASISGPSGEDLGTMANGTEPSIETLRQQTQHAFL